MAWYNTSWLYRKKITVQQTQVDGDLTNFPVYVNLADSSILANARGDMRDVLFTSADGTTKLDHELVKRKQIGFGGWTWFNNPRAIYHNGTNERVFVGAVQDTGTTANLRVIQYDHATGAVTDTVLTPSVADDDDHNSPALIVRPSDSKLVAFYANHNIDTSLRYKVSTNAEDATAWGTENTTTHSGNCTYANPIILPDDANACYVFSRVAEGAGDYNWSYKRTADYSSWGSAVEIWDGGATQSYMHVVRNGNGRIDFIASDKHPDIEAGGTSLYHFYAEWVSGALKWYDSAGTEQTLPMTPANATLVYDGSSGDDGWSHQIAIDGSNYPRVLFQKRVSTTGTGDMRCMFSRWNGSAWITPVEITALGGYVYAAQLSYTGAACFDGADINKVYLGKEVSSIYEIQEWTTSDSGATWAKSRDITSGSASGTQNLRPFSPLGHNGKLACLWIAGRYTSYTDFGTFVYCDPPLATESYVEVPTVSGSTDTDIYVYYGNSAAAAQENVTGTWNSNYKTVLHMEQAPASLSIADSTTNAINGTKKALFEPSNDEVGGQKFDAVDDYITLGTALNLAGWTEATFEIVAKHDGAGSSGDEHQLFSNWTSGNNVAQIMARVEPTAGSPSNGLEIFAIKQTDTQIGGSSGNTVTPNQNNYVSVTFDATSLRGQVNTTEGSTTYATSAAFDAGASSTFYLGNSPHNPIPNEVLGGTIYEFRVSNVARSAAWRKATSINIQTPNTFYTFGAEETDSGGAANTSAGFFGMM